MGRKNLPPGTTAFGPVAVWPPARTFGGEALGLVPLRLGAVGFSFPGHVAWRALDFLDQDAVFIAAAVLCRALDRRHEAPGAGAAHFEQGFVRGNADRADLPARDVAAAAEQRQDPAGIGINPAAHGHPEPDRILKAGPGAILPLRRPLPAI